MKSGKPPAKKALVQLALGVEDIINEFGWLGFSKPEDTSADRAQERLPGFEGAGDDANQEVDNGGRDEDEDTGEIDDEFRTFEREDIEIGIDRLISQLIKKKLIDKEKTGPQPTLWRVFTVLYGESHPILELVDSFEQHIKGYFGTIEYEEIQSAFQDIVEIEKLIKQDLEAMSA
jgi:hypothetical protein